MGAIRRLAATITVAAVLIGVSAEAAPATASAPPAGAVTARLQLAKSRVTGGSPLRGTLVLTNHTKQAIDLRQVCSPKWNVVAGTGKTAPPVAFSMVCGTEPFVVAPGSQKSPFTVGTRGLRVGKYRAFLVSSAPSFPKAKPVPFTVVAAK